jgi:hypothetical protein
MPRHLCCLALTLLAVSCVPPKATLVEEAPAVPPKATPNAEPAAPESGGAPPPALVRQSGMRVPDLVGKLPDKKDMTPTAAPAPTSGGPSVIATPPAPPAPPTAPGE